MKIMVLAGGPDREREVSLQSGRQVADALRGKGHTVYERDILPDDLSALDDAKKLGVAAVFPALHGPWGEGGPVQELLQEAGLNFVGCQHKPARLCMDKWQTKQALADSNLPTAEAELIKPGEKRSLKAPVVIKALDEGSSIGLAICKTEQQAYGAADALFEDHDRLMVEQFIAGKELTVGIIEDPKTGKPIALPPIHITPATDYYDYEAKYTREDTEYAFEIDLPKPCIELIVESSVAAFMALGCRHLARIDFIVDDQLNGYILEANTMPGFTSHSLVPKAAQQAGITFPDLCERLVLLAAK